ncbi:winged helix-turn-helix domain-containing protein [Kitasatospora sp. NPDC101801]
MTRGRQPAHTVVTEALRTRIAAGEWPPGERLPSRAALAAEYGVGDAVVQRAQEALIRECLLDGRAGSGTYLSQDRPRHQLRLDADAKFGVRPGPAGHWALLCRREGPVTLAYFVQDRPLPLGTCLASQLVGE